MKYRYKKSNIITQKTKIALFVFILLGTMAAQAEPCITPGDPIGCEIDTPIDAQVWLPIAASTLLCFYYLRSKNTKSKHIA